ncbi:cilia- and flagella-associated protein HOATZ isoform X2 [Petaurus breviceps papuanus]|uniref:cilia- and flagella-associated protein HOATZ isoform X2 n=1 Tax=Petaurus breviceps papuanus TaxID=3040969 RepID=UPI0036DEFB69
METESWGRMTGPEEPLRSVYPGLLVFTGSSEEDVALAKQFWVSATMHPHPESRLVSNSTEQRLPIARATGPSVTERSFKTRDYKTEQLLEKNRKAQEAEQKERYFQKAKKREEILNLLRKQREERIEKELVSFLHKPKVKVPKTNKEN